MHTGTEARVVLNPAPASSGINFIVGAARIPAHAEFVVNTQRCTCLGKNGGRVDTVEHLLSALWALNVDNVEIGVTGPEIPILDGSARPWVEALKRTGIQELEASPSVISLNAPVTLETTESWYIATPAERLAITCVTNFDHPLLGTEAVSLEVDPDHYETEIAPARTFGFAFEVQALLDAGLARGGSLDNALIIHEDRFSDELRVPQECLRHKTLDLLGDLSLIGARLRASITAIKPSHRANVEFAALLARLPLRQPTRPALGSSVPVDEGGPHAGH